MICTVEVGGEEFNMLVMSFEVYQKRHLSRPCMNVRGRSKYHKNFCIGDVALLETDLTTRHD